MTTFLNRNKIDIVFVDWFGVLSTNFYWCVQSQKDKLLKEWCNCVFEDADILNEWMRGKLSLEYLSEFRVKVSPDYIITKFLEDLRFYKPDSKILNTIDIMFPNAKKYLVTDNMPLFKYILNEYNYLNSYFDKMYLSHDISLLKNDKPISLFDHIQNDLGLNNFQNCLLIDDNKDNCQNFSDKGGRYILIN
ncbi:MAG: hypothetical protein K0M40_14180 [Prolixibacteraceae bacterium]|nr:hypothetical protein [Prolixibacteraceae bacterium]